MKIKTYGNKPLWLNLYKWITTSKQGYMPVCCTERYFPLSLQK